MSDVQKVLSNEPIKSMMKAAQATPKKDEIPHNIETALIPRAQAHGLHREGEDTVTDGSNNDDEIVADAEQLTTGVDSPDVAENASTTGEVDTPRDTKNRRLGRDNTHDDKVPGPPNQSITPTRSGLRKRMREASSSKESDHRCK